MALPFHSVGYDGGNSSIVTASVSGDRFTHRVFLPSAMAQTSLRELERIRIPAGSPLFGQDEYLLEFDGEETAHGALVANMGVQFSSAHRGDISRYWSSYSLRSLLVATGSSLKESEYGVCVVTGMPIESHTKVNRLRVKQALEGDHSFVLNQQPRRAVVRVATVAMEGGGALACYGVDDDDAYQGVIDIGGQTTDLYATVGTHPQNKWCRGLPLGVEHMAEMFNQFLDEQLPGYALNPRQMAQFLRSRVGKEKEPHLTWKGQDVHLPMVYDCYDRAVSTIGRNIVTFVAQTWRTNELGDVAANFRKVILAGGGAYYFRDTIRALLLPEAVVPDEPEYANAYGYAMAADVAMASQRANLRMVV